MHEIAPAPSPRSPRRGPGLAFVLGALALGSAACAQNERAPLATSGDANAPEVPAAAAPAAPPAPSAPQAPASEPQATAPAPPAEKAPDLNVLMISIDSLRADMPWAGYGRDIAPTLTAFEKEAVSYTRHYSISSYTAMSLGGFLAGRYPSEVERSGYFFGNYPDSVVMFPELLQKAGVATLSAHAHFYFDQKAGFRQGFDVYEIVPGLSADNTTDRNVSSPAHLELATKILGDKARTRGRFFAWFHLLDPHDQYMPHAGIAFGKKARDLYDGEIAFVDQHVKKLLDFVAAEDWGKRTAIIVTSDHGEAFGEHKMYRHGFEIYEMLVHVPLMIRAPGAKPRRIDTPRSSIDLAPTILELLGAPAEPSFQGKSLVPELGGGAAEERDVIVDLPRTSDNDRRRALVRGRYKLISFGDDDGFALYDVVSDPDEKRDLKREDKEAFEDMKARYKAASEKIRDICPKNTQKLKGVKKGRKC
jgi:arylsulfatase A-like enzyme